MTDARDDLLRRVIDDVAHHGIGDRSLRELATAVGSSHRMLIYHFGSREGLVSAIVAEVEARQRSLMSVTDPMTDPVDIVREVWRRVSDPQMRPFVRLFFEAVSYSPRRSGGLGDDGELTRSWVDQVAELSGRMARPADSIDVRLGIAVIRGLLVDVLAGGDINGATESLERFLVIWSRPRSRR